MQSWGSDSNFEFRRTNREPTKSGVIGMIAASMGRRRDESLDDLASLRFGVRVDQPGRVERDFHMVHKDKKTSYLTYRD
jgi:CRISPR system Cascade subunit CasD